ncbi:MAG TPA: phosphoribosylanthranilate isomerase [Candidatus Acidoferrales bacterium]|nr:phosphoribosylanthranilate isomerase [Candidatus Acidoferrales bacterium]
MVSVKICGITNWADAKLAVDSGADALGFNFYRRSPRRISFSRARKIISKLPREITAVGVFVNASEKEILRIARGVKLGFLQLHGEESPRSVERLALEFPVIKAFRVGPKFQARELQKFKNATAFLLDGFEPRRHGGTGKTFDWRLLNAAKRFGPVILAGGLRSENVADAIRKAKPFAIDVCSGIETRPGKKDAGKVKSLMAEVERARHKL